MWRLLFTHHQHLGTDQQTLAVRLAPPRLLGRAPALRDSWKSLAPDAFQARASYRRLWGASDLGSSGLKCRGAGGLPGSGEWVSGRGRKGCVRLGLVERVPLPFPLDSMSAVTHSAKPNLRGSNGCAPPLASPAKRVWVDSQRAAITPSRGGEAPAKPGPRGRVRSGQGGFRFREATSQHGRELLCRRECSDGSWPSFHGPLAP